MAQGIKSIYTLRNCDPESFKKTLINSLVISHLQYPAVLLCSLSQNLIATLEKQLNCTVTACYNSKRFDSSHDLKLRNNILLVRMLIQYRVALYTRQIFNYKKQAFKNISGIPLQTGNFCFHNRTKKLVNKIIARTKYIEQGVINSGVRYHNEILRAN